MSDADRPSSPTRDCFRCGRSFYDDGNTWCPASDTAENGPRVGELRRWMQANLAAGRPEQDPTGKPAWL